VYKGVMMNKYVCPECKCENALSPAEDLAHKYTCKTCGTVVSKVQPLKPEVKEEPAKEEAKEVVIEEPKPKRKRKSKKKIEDEQ
jgi:DNA-directed RNA polymerase subunit M/transcription elongation factor TFIIS